MKVLSVNVGMPRDVQIDDRTVATGIYKVPITERVRVRILNLDGDRQADLTVHGGTDKAVYAYPSEHYAFWRDILGEDLSWGAFGENLTIEGLSEQTGSVGDQLGIGTATFVITQPRLPCFKLAAKFQRDKIIKEFLDSRRTGFYLKVAHEGTLQAGDPIHVLRQAPERFTIREVTDLYLTKEPKASQLERVLSVMDLAASWRHHFTRILGTDTEF